MALVWLLVDVVGIYCYTLLVIDQYKGSALKNILLRFAAITFCLFAATLLSIFAVYNVVLMAEWLDE